MEYKDADWEMVREEMDKVWEEPCPINALFNWEPTDEQVEDIGTKFTLGEVRVEWKSNG